MSRLLSASLDATFNSSGRQSQAIESVDETVALKPEVEANKAGLLGLERATVRLY